jgi:hypothetical protein
MLAILCLLTTSAANLFKSRCQLEVENLFLRHQLNIALRRAPRRLWLHGSDRAVLVWLTRLWPSLIGLTRVVQPDTILRWHRSGFRAYWRWKSLGRPGRPRVNRELRDHPLLGVKRTSAAANPMSAFDPKRTWRDRRNLPKIEYCHPTEGRHAPPRLLSAQSLWSFRRVIP